MTDPILNKEAAFGVEPYEVPRGIHWMPPTARFGYPNDFSLLFGDERKTYADGLVLAASLSMVAFLLWMLIASILACLGKDRVGFWSGAPFQEDAHDAVHIKTLELQAGDDESTQNSGMEEIRLSENHTGTQSQLDASAASMTTRGASHNCRGWSPQDRIQAVRCIFLTSGVVFLVALMVIATSGLPTAQSAVDSFYQSSMDVRMLLQEARQIVTNEMVDIRTLAKSVRGRLQQELGRIQEGAEALEQIDVLIDLTTFDTNAVDAVLRAIQWMAGHIERTTKYLDFHTWKTIVVLQVFAVFPACLMVSAVANATGTSWRRQDFLIRWVVLPFFMLLVFIAICVTTVMVIASTASRDACLPGGLSNTPDFTILDSIRQAGLDGAVYQFVYHYVSFCTVGEHPTDFLNDFLPNIEESMSTVESLAMRLRDETVSGDDYVALKDLVDALAQLLSMSSWTIAGATHLMACERIVPIYVEAVYIGVCTHTLSAVWRFWAAVLAMAISGMIMITLRASAQLGKRCRMDTETETRYEDVMESHSI